MITRTFAVITLCALVCMAAQVTRTDLYRVDHGDITFLSDAPHERITATSHQIDGVLDAAQRSFAVEVSVRSFQGFNSPLQREHFNESYLESDALPNSVFQGRIIEALDLTKPGEYNVRAKGHLTIHAVEHERIIPCKITVDAGGVRVRSSFDVLLADHNIRVPMIVQQKISPVINVSVDLHFRKEPLTK